MMTGDGLEIGGIRLNQERRTHLGAKSIATIAQISTAEPTGIAAGLSAGLSEIAGKDSGSADRSRRPRVLRRKSRRRYEKLRRDPLAQALIMRLAREHRVSLSDLMQGGRGSGNASHTRQMAMYLCYVLLRRTQEQLGELFDRDRKTVSHACAQIEWQRESDRTLDRELSAFEAEGWVEAAQRERGLPRDAV